MKPTDDDYQPRRDGLFEHKATWGEVTLGTMIANKSARTQRWQIIDVAQASQVEFGHTLWMRARELSTGEEYTVTPRFKKSPVIILTEDPADTFAGELAHPTNAESIALLVKELGATHLAARDEKTGEITCPSYDTGENHLDEIGNSALSRGLIEHLAFAHAIKIPADMERGLIWTMHNQSHNPQFPTVGKGGFPHRHVPEDLTYF